MKNARKGAVLLLALCLIFTLAFTGCKKGGTEATNPSDGSVVDPDKPATPDNDGSSNGGHDEGENNNGGEVTPSDPTDGNGDPVDPTEDGSNPVDPTEDGSKPGDNDNEGLDKLVDYKVEGGLYTGTAVNGVPTGTGYIIYDTGNFYQGPVKNGKPDGHGIMMDKVSDGTYEGNFVNGLYNDDKGKFAFNNGCFYEGGFKDGRMKGQGKHTWPKDAANNPGPVLIGNFLGTANAPGVVGNLDVEGTLKYPGGINFKGSIITGLPTKGTFCWPDNGPEFKGTFNQFLNGYGNLDMKNGIVYHGPMSAGVLTPNPEWNETGKQVKINYPDNGLYCGEVFTGKYVQNSKGIYELKGIITKPNGTVRKNAVIALDWSFGFTADPDPDYLTNHPVKGGKYTGTAVNFEPTGEGKIVYDNGDLYEGSVKKGIPDGKGTMKYKASGDVYTGKFSNGVYSDSNAKYVFKNGCIYEGAFVDGQIKGSGKLTLADKTVISGKFDAASVKNAAEGKLSAADGTITYTDAKFTGSFVNGVPAEGKFEWADRTFEGKFTGKLTGYGKLTMKDGLLYAGPVTDGKLATNDVWTASKEQVIIQYPANKTYHGEIFQGNYVFNADTKQNELRGTVVMQDGTIYNNVLVQLDYTFAYKAEAGSKFLTDFPVEGGKYTGTAVDGVPTGNGVIKYKNGNQYTGDVVNGKPEGSGVMVNADAVAGGTYTGKFHNGLYSDENGKYAYNNGFLYEGSFADGLINGQGKFTWPGNGPTFTGTMTGFATGYGDLDMKNGVIYHGPMVGGGLAANPEWIATGEKVVITYPENAVFYGEKFEGQYENGKLIGTVTLKNGTVVKNADMSLNFSFVYVVSDSADYLNNFAVAGGKYAGTATDGAATGFGTITFDNKNVYHGEVKDGKPNGDGCMIDPNEATGSIYTGKFNNGVFEDKNGKIVFSNGFIYEGSFVAGQFNGQGKFTWPDNGPAFTGTMTGFLNGYGDLDMKNGIIYHGPMTAGVLKVNDEWLAAGDKVKITYPENEVFHGEVFDGTYVAGQLKGKIIRKDGTEIPEAAIALDWSFNYVSALSEAPVEGGKYTGTSVNGAVTGEGFIFYDNGSMYSGPVRDGKPEGKGTMSDAVSGGSYTGKFHNGLYNDDKGVFKYNNKCTYTGSFVDGVMKGQGLFTWPTGEKAEGEFLGHCDVPGSIGNLDLKGTITWTNGMNYTGNLVNGLPLYPCEGTFGWPGGIPAMTGKFTNYLNGYGDLNMGGGLVYHGPMCNGALAPTPEWLATGEKVTIQYPDTATADDQFALMGEVFEGEFIKDPNGLDVLAGTITYKDGKVINVVIRLDFSFGYIPV